MHLFLRASLLSGYPEPSCNNIYLSTAAIIEAPLTDDDLHAQKSSEITIQPLKNPQTALIEQKKAHSISS